MPLNLCQPIGMKISGIIVVGWRISMAIMTYLVDLFDVYDKVEEGLVDKVI